MFCSSSWLHWMGNVQKYCMKIPQKQTQRFFVLLPWRLLIKKRYVNLYKDVLAPHIIESWQRQNQIMRYWHTCKSKFGTIHPSIFQFNSTALESSHGAISHPSGCMHCASWTNWSAQGNSPKLWPALATVARFDYRFDVHVPCIYIYIWLYINTYTYI